MSTWIAVVISSSVSLAIGLVLPSILRKLSGMASGGFRNRRKDRLLPLSETHSAKLIATLLALFALAVASWFFSYYVKQQKLDPIWGEIAVAVFGVCTAGLLGGVIFEAFLRREILAEASTTLAEIVTTDKEIVRGIFSREKRNEIIETMLQINTGNEVYGSALYSDFVALFTEEALGPSREFRFGFRDDVTFCDIAAKHGDLATKYYEVVDRLSYRAELNPNRSIFILGCASTEDQLYSLFSDPACIYRWLLKASDFKSLMKGGKGFTASLIVDGIPCQPLSERGTLTERGFEICFKNPFTDKGSVTASSQEASQLAEFRIEVHTLHPREERVLSVHLAYPVRGAEISFDYEAAEEIRNVTKLHFLTAGKHSPRIEEGAKPLLGDKRHRLSVRASDDHWLFPDSGVTFVW